MDRVYDDSLADEAVNTATFATKFTIEPPTTNEKLSNHQADNFGEKAVSYEEKAFIEEPPIHQRPSPSTFAVLNDFDQPLSRQICLPDLSRGVRVSYCHYALILLSISGLFACLIILGFLEFARASPTPIVVTNNIGFGIQSPPSVIVIGHSPPIAVDSPVSLETLQSGIPMSTPTTSAISHEVTTMTLISEMIAASSSSPIVTSASLGNQTQSSIVATVSAPSTVSFSKLRSSSSMIDTSVNTTLSTAFPGPSIIITTTLVTSVSPTLPSRRPVVPLTRSFTGPGPVGQILGSQ